MRRWLVLILFLLGLGTLRVTACGEDSCVDDEDCNDGNPCTWGRCPEPPRWDFSVTFCEDDEQTCQRGREQDGTPCGSGKVCVGGACGENRCAGVVCDDGLDCTRDECVFKNGECRFTSTCDDEDECTEDVCNPVSGSCDYTTPVEDGEPCWEDEPGVRMCQAGVCVPPCDPASTVQYQCPIPDFNDLSCCPGWSGCKNDEQPGQPGCQVACFEDEDCVDPFYCIWGFCRPLGPGDWTCTPEYYGTDDGCDCGCGVLDPDCTDGTVASCDFCDDLGSCSSASCPGDIDPTQNWFCQEWRLR